MKTLRLSVWSALLALGAGCASSPAPEQSLQPSHPPSGPDQEMASLAPPVAAAREVPPLYQAEMDAKERVLLRIRLAEMQAGNLRPRFGNTPVETLAPAKELESLRREHAIAFAVQAPLPGTPGAPAPVAVAGRSTQPANTPAGEAVVPPPTGKASGREPPAEPEDQPAVVDPPLAKPEAEPVQSPATEPRTSAGEPSGPTPTGKVSRKPVLAVRDKEQALSELSWLYLEDKITAGEYFRHRAEVLTEP